MRQRLRSHLTYANVMSTLGVFLVLGGGTALASYVVTSNTQIGRKTVSGHDPPTGKHANVIPNSLNAYDLARGAVTTRKLVTFAVTHGKLALNAVTGINVFDDSLSGADIAESTLGTVPSAQASTTATNADNATHAANADHATNADNLGGIDSTGFVLKAPEPWNEVGRASTNEDLCADPSNTAVFCSRHAPGGLTFDPWSNYGGGFATAAFYADQLGIVHLKGLVQSAVSLTSTDPVTRPIFRLPAAYRPTSQRTFASIGSESADGQEVAQARIDVTPGGLVELITDCPTAFGQTCSASGQYITLDGIAFRPDE